MKKKKYYKFHFEQYPLYPTQAVVGDHEVRHKVGIIHGFNKKKDLDAYLKKHVVPVVIGPPFNDGTGTPYIIDNHHFVKAITQTYCTDYIYCELLQDLKQMKQNDFWRLMVENNWIYLKDEIGNSIPPKKLPKDFLSLKNDPYRSLAWMCREYGGFDKVYVPFSEFLWANFFRERIKIHNKDHQLYYALTKALKLAKSKEAKHLPGYKGKR
jgi:hypothetical protein